VSPGAALVFLLVGPATNVTSLSVLFGILGKRATAIYLTTLSLFAVVSGLVLDQVYGSFGISAKAIAGQAGEVIPYWLQLLGAAIVILLSIKPIYLILRNVLSPNKVIPQKKSGDDKGSASSMGDNKTECTAPT
jgi:hypothetical protein